MSDLTRQASQIVVRLTAESVARQASSLSNAFLRKELVTLRRGTRTRRIALVPLADGTLVATRDLPSEELIPSLLATSDVLGTGWFAADAADVKPASTVVVVGDGAVGLLAVLSPSRWVLSGSLP